MGSAAPRTPSTAGALEDAWELFLSLPSPMHPSLEWSLRMSTPTQVVILGGTETTKSANLMQERQRCLPQRWGSTLCHITTSLRLWTTWQTADPSPHQWPPQTGVSTMVACLTDVPTTRI